MKPRTLNILTTVVVMPWAIWIAATEPLFGWHL